MRSFFYRFTVLYFLMLVSFFGNSCGGGTCPELDSSQVDTYRLQSGTYEMLEHYPADFAHGEPRRATLEVDLESRTAILTYRVEGGSEIVEGYTFTEPVVEFSEMY